MIHQTCGLKLSTKRTYPFWFQRDSGHHPKDGWIRKKMFQKSIPNLFLSFIFLSLEWIFSVEMWTFSRGCKKRREKEYRRRGPPARSIFVVAIQWNEKPQQWKVSLDPSMPCFAVKPPNRRADLFKKVLLRSTDFESNWSISITCLVFRDSLTANW